jgi:hypothetical protein
MKSTAKDESVLSSSMQMDGSRSEPQKGTEMSILGLFVAKKIN